MAVVQLRRRSDFSTVRMYRSFGETWEGFTKNIRAVFEDQGMLFWVFGLAQWALMFAPFHLSCHRAGRDLAHRRRASRA